jgi:Domain of unknown function (DUF4129)
MREKAAPGGGKALAPTAAVILLMLLSIVALRGHLPGARRHPEPDELDGGGAGSLVAVAVMSAVSMLVIAIAILSQARQRRIRPGAGELPRERLREPVALRWRPLLIAAAVLVAWALLILLLMRWVSPVDVGEPPASDPGGDAAGGTSGDAPPQQEPQGNGGNVFGILAAATILLLVLSIAATVLGRRRTPPAAQAPPEESASTAGPVGGADLARAAELGLAAMGDLSRDPRAAIIACYLAMERELEKSPGTVPRDSDTPSEVLARAIEQQALPADSATVLVDLFEEARFSPHVMDEGHRADAMGALQSVQRELQAAS